MIGGIKTNLSLFRRILLDDGFRTAQIDTGYLERLLAHPALATVAAVIPPEIAALAAAIFASASAAPVVSQGAEVESAWALAARREGLRT